VAGAFDDELEAARQLLGRPWRAAAFVGAGVDEVLPALGSAREGLLGPTQWVARVAEPPDEGPTADWFVSSFRDAVGSEPAYPAAAAFAAGVLAARCIRDAGTAADDALLTTARRLGARTLFGRFQLDSATGLQVGAEILVVQWQAGERRVVWPLHKAERQILPLPGR
jgi:branched-chain amino acid transport system substrate-binding protein